MVRDIRNPKISVIVPTLNEAENLPLLLGDLSLFDEFIELIIIDGGSQDKTKLIGELFGANVFLSERANRGYQLNYGAKKSKCDYFLFLHADSRISKKSLNYLLKAIQSKEFKKYAWFFNFRVAKKSLMFRLLEIAVYLRSHVFKKPYGDQGLIISRDLYYSIGGYKDLHLMEDLDFVFRLSKPNKLKCLGFTLITGTRKWDKKGVIKNAILNAQLRSRWKKGASSKSLSDEYYL